MVYGPKHTPFLNGHRRKLPAVVPPRSVKSITRAAFSGAELRTSIATPRELPPAPYVSLRGSPREIIRQPTGMQLALFRPHAHRATSQRAWSSPSGLHSLAYS